MDCKTEEHSVKSATLWSTGGIAREKRMSVLQRAIDHFDLRTYVEDTFPEHIDAASGEELRINCFSPHGCNGSDNDRKLYVNPDKMQWICFKCGYGTREQPGTYSLVRFIADAEGIHQIQAKDRILKASQITPEEEFAEVMLSMFNAPTIPPDPPPRYITYPPEFRPLYQSTSKLSIPFLTYAKERGMDEMSLLQNDVRYCRSPNREWNWRLIIPIYDLEGRPRSATGRTLATSERIHKWHHWPKSDLSYLLWPLGIWDNTKTWIPFAHDGTPVVLTEGIFDAWAVSAFTTFHAFCTFGKKLSIGQIKLLLTMGVKEIILAWDYNARKEMMDAAQHLEEYAFTVTLFPFIDVFWRSCDLGDTLTKLTKMQASIILEAELTNTISKHSPLAMTWMIQ